MRAWLGLMPLLLLGADEAQICAALTPAGGHAVLTGSVLPLALLAVDWDRLIRAERCVPLFAALAGRGAVMLAILTMVARHAGLERGFAFRLALVLGSMLLARALTLAVWRSAERRGFGRTRIAILGASPASERVARRLARPGLRGVTVSGCFGDDPAGVDALLQLGRDGGVDQVLLAFTAADTVRLDRALSALKALDVPVSQYACFADADWSDARLDQVDAVPMALLLPRAIPLWGRIVKSTQDKVLSCVVLFATLPVLIAIAVAIRLDSPGPILFRQSREGRNGRNFDILKFRTMTWRSEEPGADFRQTERGDRRITRVGRVLRATSLDELPQLLNVLRGEMSLVGPRPHPRTMTTEERLSTEIDVAYPHRHRVKPGMTGWAQVNGSRGALASAEDLTRRLRYDLDYIENWSPLLDLKIKLMTPLKLLFHQGNAF